MGRLLIRSGKDPFTPVGAEATLAQDVFNTNVGNYLFAHSVHKTLMTPGTELVSNATLSETRPATKAAISRVNEEFDAFVVPLANAFRPQFVNRLANLTSLIAGLEIPVVVVGVGAQADLALDEGQLAEVSPTATAFVAAVLDRSATIGVRGDFTAGYLRGLGFPDSAIDVIGCPSLFLNGPDFRVSAPDDSIARDARIALSVTRHVPGLGELCAGLADRHPNLVYVGQDRDDLRLMVWGEPPDDPADPRLPLHPEHPLYRQDRVRFPLDTWTWLDYLAQFDFSVGTRFHGAVAAILADTPATLLVHDSRTLELAEYHELPRLPMSAVNGESTLSELYDAFDPGRFNAGYAQRFEAYLAFLERNGLQHVHAPGNDNPEFARRVREATFPPLLTPLHSPRADQVAARLRWLRDGQAFDSAIQLQAYRQPFPYPPPRERSTRQKQAQAATERKVARLERQLDAAAERLRASRRRLQRQDERLRRQEQSLREQGRRLSAVEEQLARADRSLAGRVGKALSNLRPTRRGR